MFWKIITHFFYCKYVFNLLFRKYLRLTDAFLYSRYRCKYSSPFFRVVWQFANFKNRFLYTLIFLDEDYLELCLATEEVDGSELALELQTYYLLILLIGMLFSYQLLLKAINFFAPEQDSWYKKLIEFFFLPPRPWYKFW